MQLSIIKNLYTKHTKSANHHESCGKSHIGSNFNSFQYIGLSTGMQGRPKAPPATRQNVSQKSRGTKIRKLGAKFKFGQLILRKIIKIVVTRCNILRLKCTKFDFGWGFAPDLAGRAHSAFTDLLAKGSYF